MSFNLLEILCEANLETFDEFQGSREKTEELLYNYINKFLSAPPEQKRELKELISLCLGSYKRFIRWHRKAMRVSKKLSPKWKLEQLEKELKEPDLERLN